VSSILCPLVELTVSQRMPACSCQHYRIPPWMPVLGCTLGSSVHMQLIEMISLTSLGSAVQLLAQVSLYILAGKVRSRALLFLYKLFFQVVYHVFYRNLVSLLRHLGFQGSIGLVRSAAIPVAVCYCPASFLSTGRRSLPLADDEDLVPTPSVYHRIPSFIRGPR